MNTNKNRFDKPKHTIIWSSSTALDEPTVEPEQPLSAFIAETTSLSSGLAIAAVVIFVGKTCRNSSIPIRDTLLALVHRHAKRNELTAQLAITWLFRNEVIGSLKTPSMLEGLICA